MNKIDTNYNKIKNPFNKDIKTLTSLLNEEEEEFIRTPFYSNSRIGCTILQ